MNILGISCFYHDSAACLLTDGRLIAAVQEERFSRRKNDPRFPKMAIDYCLSEGELNVHGLDYVVFYDKPFLTFERLLLSHLTVAPRGIKSWLASMPLWLGQKLHVPKILKQELGYAGPVLYTEHHEAHAASGFYPSPFEEAAILTVDGVGEWASASYGVGRGKDLEILKELHFPDSIGLLYSAFTYFAGFRVNSGEYKMMGLAPYGKPIYTNLILSEIIDLKEDGSIRLNMSLFDFMGGLRMTNRRFARIFGGPPREPEAPITQREMDIAASIQKVAEEIVMRMVRHVHRETGMQHLCMAGGVALNCVANGRILREGPFEGVWIQPAAGDAGGALGAAFSVWHRFLNNKRTTAQRPDGQHGSYLGPSFQQEEIQAFLDAHTYPYTVLEADRRALRIAAEIEQGNIVGYLSGRMEFGPRALGARSIIADPRKKEIGSVLNRKIKNRESFRPFAPSVMEEKAGDYFDIDRPSPYMLLTANVREERRLPMPTDENMEMLEKLDIPRSDIPAITHLDYSARLQSVSKTNKPDYHAVLAAFERLTGYPVVVNTSFNVRGEPIVCTPQDAYRCFMRTGMDVLVLENAILYKDEQPPWSGGQAWRDKLESENGKPTDRDSRRLGLAILLLGGVLCSTDLWQAAPAPFFFGGSLGLVGLGFLALPGPMQPVYHGWLKMAHFTGTVLTTVMLAFCFYLVVTPTAWIKRLFGGRPLPMKPDPGAATYWIRRQTPAQPKERFYKRY